MPRSKIVFRPRADQMALWPAVSGNSINGVGNPRVDNPRPVYWHDPDRTAQTATTKTSEAQRRRSVMDATP